MSKEELTGRAREYAQRRGLVLGEQLGFGVHGIVFVSESQPEKSSPPARSAIKVHEHESAYHRERDIYLRLKEKGVTSIHGCHVPHLLGHDDELWIIEMTVVARPFVLDFAGAYLDHPPQFSDEIMADWRAEKVEQFGKQWPKVETILRQLETIGIYVIDVTPNNVSLVD